MHHPIEKDKTAKSTKLRLAYMGTPDFSIPPLAALIEAGHDICAVYTQPPRPGGRGKQLQKTPVHQFAEEKGITVRTPTSLRTQESQLMFSKLAVDATVVAAYGLILPVEILKIPRFGCINIHASLLPRWRGAAPIQRAIMAGDKETGVCIMIMNEGLDTGPILDSQKIDIKDNTTGASLHDTLASIGATLIVKTLDAFTSELIEPVPQGDNGAVYAKKLSKDEGHIDWSKSAKELERLIRALNPWPGAWCLLDNERLKIHKSKVLDEERIGYPIGTAISDDFSIACGQGVLKIEAVQKPGKKVMSTIDYLRGNPLKIGDCLE